MARNRAERALGGVDNLDGYLNIQKVINAVYRAFTEAKFFTGKVFLPKFFTGKDFPWTKGPLSSSQKPKFPRQNLYW
jgi:hypothetical protein